MTNRKTKYLLWTIAIAAIVAAGFGLYKYSQPDKYRYWKELITKDPKPDGVSEEEYREKLRAGYCWRDRKFYTPEELQQKAMVGFTGRLLGEAEAYKTDQTTNQGGRAYTGADCERHEKACKVWFVPQDHTNEQWDKLFLAEKNPTDFDFLNQYMDKEIKQPDDLGNYLKQHGGKGFSLFLRGSGKGGAYVYGSDCCKVLNEKKAEPVIKNNSLITYVEDAAIFPENKIPENIKIKDYGVGNFYINTSGLIVFVSEWVEGEKNLPEKFFRNISNEQLWRRIMAAILY